MSGWALKRPRNFFVVSRNILFGFADIPRAISISQSKRGGYRTRHSFFMIENVALEQNFWFWCSFRAYVTEKASKRALLGRSLGASEGSKNFSRASLHLSFVFADILRSIAISQSKWYGRATPHSFFIFTNVSQWSFFGFDTQLELNCTERDGLRVRGRGVLKRSRKVFVRSLDILFAFVDIPRTISIFQSKRGGHMMLGSSFMIENMSLKWNLGPDHRFWR